ncbi:hypothetical protein H0H93_009966, partial [Arthromyces matolae]
MGAIAKWLRRQIRIFLNSEGHFHLFLFEGAGSNPAGVACQPLWVFLLLNLMASQLSELPESALSAPDSKGHYSQGVTATDLNA